ncbi:MAG: hypothetical protein N4A72_19250 [Bacteroidales bacterium]|jgi:hypothetical protein|nr:hypothetical protein [Bacteroidales bacterium]
MRYRYILILLIITFCAEFANGGDKVKNKEKKIALMSHVDSLGKIMIRWAPSDPILWKRSNVYGYTVVRYKMTQNGELLKNNTKVILTKEPKKPLPVEQWESISENNKYAAIAAEAIYGNSFIVESENTDIMSMVNAARDLDNRFSFALFGADNSFKIADMMGLAFYDEDVESGCGYLYKVYSNAPIKYTKSDTASVYVEAGKQTKLPKIVMAKARFGNKETQLSWPFKMYRGVYTSFVIEKSVNNPNHFTPINKLPYTIATKSPVKDLKSAYFVDTLEQVGINYYYRIKGVNPFGFSGPYSDTMCVETFTRFKEKPQITDIKVIDNKEVLVTWDFPIEYNMQSQGFRVMVSSSINKDYKPNTSKLLKPHTRQYTIKNPSRVSYIVVEAVDAGGNNYSSMPQMALLKDLVPPSKPKGLLGVSDSLGNITITWQRNMDDDLLGYRVYMANNADDEYSQITNKAITKEEFKYKVPLNTLNNSIYFKVQAIDQVFNRSLMSDFLKVDKPDTIPPTSPVITSVTYKNRSVILKWNRSYSGDVKKQYVVRFSDNINDTIASFIEQTEIFIDKKLGNVSKYEYTVISVDNSNNHSRNNKRVSVKIPKRAIALKGVFNAVVDRNKGAIVLNLKYSKSKTKMIYIYRAATDGRYRMIKSMYDISNIYEDRNVKANTTYKYRVRATFNDGTSSKMSDEIVVNY